VRERLDELEHRKAALEETISELRELERETRENLARASKAAGSA